jgi:hypothetical protein
VIEFFFLSFPHSEVFHLTNNSLCSVFQKINGEALLTLTKEKCFDLTGGKAGPSIKIAHLITCLNKIVQNPNRFKSALKKPLL